MANAKTNPGKTNTNPNAANGNTLQCTAAVLANTYSVWGTMVTLLTGKAYQLTSINYNATGQAVAYNVTTQAGLTATVPANMFNTPYTGYCVAGLHYGASKLAVCMGTVPGLTRY